MTPTRFIAVILFWALIGVTWAITNENIVQKIATQYPEPIILDAGTWEILNYVWTISIILVATGTGIGLLGADGLISIIKSGAVLFCGMLLVIYLWASMWLIVNETIPTALSIGQPTNNHGQYKNIYDMGFIVIMLGLGLGSLLIGGTAQIGRSGRRIETRAKGYYPKIIIPKSKQAEEENIRPSASMYETYQKTRWKKRFD